MNQKIIPLLLAAIGSSAAAAPTVEAPNYYDYDGPAVRTHRQPPAATASGQRKSFVVEGDAGPMTQLPRAAAMTGQEDSVGIATQGTQPPLPPNMDKGVHDLEAGMDDLQAYTAVMAAHIQRNGMRGFLAVPPEIKDQGVAVGRKIGGGINGIMTDVAHEMIVPEKR